MCRPSQTPNRWMSLQFTLEKWNQINAGIEWIQALLRERIQVIPTLTNHTLISIKARKKDDFSSHCISSSLVEQWLERRCFNGDYSPSYTTSPTSLHNNRLESSSTGSSCPAVHYSPRSASCYFAESQAKTVGTSLLHSCASLIRWRGVWLP